MGFQNDPLFTRYILDSQKKTALDVGCSSQGAVQVLATKYEYVVGVDMCKKIPKEYSILKNKQETRKLGFKNIDFVLAAAQNPPFKNGVFDAIVCSHVMEHLMQPDEVAKKLVNMLRDDGKLFVAVPWLSELYTMNFSRNPIFQWGKLLLVRALDELRFNHKGMLHFLFFHSVDGRVLLRWFMPKTYVASKWYKDTIRLQDYVDEFLSNKLYDPHHKHWFTRGEYLRILQGSGRLVGCIGICNLGFVVTRAIK
ncbi:MAG: class I SAM-dependent methyltransferase [Candidatus Bathyarchaeia archaeon]|jgi:2-polyprenyl-3-methyl-5-hydroxy-6-metoxy-1,4-benzoquinol methylase